MPKEARKTKAANYPDLSYESLCQLKDELTRDFQETQLALTKLRSDSPFLYGNDRLRQMNTKRYKVEHNLREVQNEIQRRIKNGEVPADYVPKPQVGPPQPKVGPQPRPIGAQAQGQTGQQAWPNGQWAPLAEPRAVPQAGAATAPQHGPQTDKAPLAGALVGQLAGPMSAAAFEPFETFGHDRANAASEDFLGTAPASSSLATAPASAGASAVSGLPLGVGAVPSGCGAGASFTPQAVAAILNKSGAGGAHLATAFPPGASSAQMPSILGGAQLAGVPSSSGSRFLVPQAPGGWSTGTGPTTIESGMTGMAPILASAAACAAQGMPQCMSTNVAPNMAPGMNTPLMAPLQPQAGAALRTEALRAMPGVPAAFRKQPQAVAAPTPVSASCVPLAFQRR